MIDMGDRVSIQFVKGHETSVVLFSHWGGMNFPERAVKYVKELKKDFAGKSCYPLERLEPETVMVDFIREIAHEEKRIMSDLYLGKDPRDGDNSDNGNWLIDLDTAEMRQG